MKIKNLIFEKKQYFVTIEKIHSSDQLSVMDAYRINRLVRKLTELNEEFQELKKKITDQYGTLNEEEGTITISAEDRTEFNTEYNELIDIEHDLEDEKLPFPKKIEDGFSATDLNILETFFDLSGLEETLTEQK
jgi:septal ring factor EnvC (AmiA/AmiB activator)